MARFYLNIRQGEELSRIPSPLGYDTPEEARENALVTMRAWVQMGTMHPLEANQRQIEIADADTNHPVCIVTCHDAALDLPKTG